jgi:hypothetical protein
VGASRVTFAWSPEFDVPPNALACPAYFDERPGGKGAGNWRLIYDQGDAARCSDFDLERDLAASLED